MALILPLLPYLAYNDTRIYGENLMGAKHNSQVRMNLGKKTISKVTKLKQIPRSGNRAYGKRSVARLDMASVNNPSVRAKLKRYRLSKSAQRKVRTILLLVLGLTLIVASMGGIWLFAYVQKLNEELPSIDAPFGKRENASTFLDRNGVELYKYFAQNINYARDPVKIEEIPEVVKWAFLASEDIDFYTHQGFDPAAIIRCGLNLIQSGGQSVCGGSTITQQVVKLTSVGSEVKLERKLKELLMAIKIEQAYSKDEILQLYLTVAPFGGNVYGVTTAADFYFRKNPKDLSLAEATLLAGIIQNPTYLSPTVGLPDPETAKAKAKNRQLYVLGQMENYIDKINSQTRVNKEDPEMDDILTLDMIEQARTAELVYQPPVLTDMKAGHFVDYVKARLTQGNYKYGEEPFTDTELMTGGYTIYTTLDYDIQQIAERSVADAVAQYGPAYNIHNGALVTLQPSTGEVISMVGSKSYYGESEGCDANGQNCLFDPQVNIILSRQSPGSSTKPFGTYEAYRRGLLFTGSFLPDIPIDVGGGYNLKNWNGTYFGISPKTYSGQMLSDSRNLPAVIVVELIGIPRFLQVMTEFGYTTFEDNGQYGHSVILGGSDVIPLEHAQGFGVLANGGDLVAHEVIKKIVDRDGNVVWEHNPERQRVADERAVYMVNWVLNNSHGMSWDGRDVAMKTGTSEDSTDIWVNAWSPDFVTVAWMGNNNNATMDYNAFGVSVITPWLKGYMNQVGESTYFAARTPFSRPAGLHEGGGCTEPCSGNIVGLAQGLMLDGVDYPVDNIRGKMVTVCSDQQDKLARPIDIAMGYGQQREAPTYIMPVPQWQHFLDSYMLDQSRLGNGLPNGGPTEYCDIPRAGATGPMLYSFNIADGTVISNNVTFQGTAYTPSGSITSIQFTFDTLNLTPATNIDSSFKFDATYTIPSTFENGIYPLTVTITDSLSRVYTATYSVVLNSSTNTNMALTFTPAGTGTGGAYIYGTDIGAGTNIQARLTYTGTGTLTSPALYVSQDAGTYTLVGTMVPLGGNVYTLNWGAAIIDDDVDSTYSFYVQAAKPGSGGTFKSPPVVPITVDE